MPHSIEFSDDSPIITVVYIGEVSLDERLATVLEVCDRLTPAMTVRLLIDVRLVINTMTKQEQEFFGRYLANKPALKNAQIAVLSKEVNPNQIINNTACLNGYHLSPFTSKSEAIDWLEASPA